MPPEVEGRRWRGGGVGQDGQGGFEVLWVLNVFVCILSQEEQQYTSLLLTGLLV